MSEEEERLFMLMEGIKEQTELAEQHNNSIATLVEHSKQQQNSIAELIASKEKSDEELAEVRKENFQHTGQMVKLSIDQTKDKMLNAIADGAYNGVKHSISESINDVNKTLNEGINRAEQASIESAESFTNTVGKAEKVIIRKANEIDEHLTWKLIGIWGGGVFLISIIALVFYIVYVPSPTEVRKLKAEYEKYSKVEGIVISNCGGNACVRVDTKKCGYGKQQDFCIIKK